MKTKRNQLFFSILIIFISALFVSSEKTISIGDLSKNGYSFTSNEEFLTVTTEKVNDNESLYLFIDDDSFIGEITFSNKSFDSTDKDVIKQTTVFNNVNRLGKYVFTIRIFE